MRALRPALFAVLLASFAFAADAPKVKSSPATRCDNVTETIQGVKITDPYRWLEDQNSPETRKWINEQRRARKICFYGLI
jgi:prolyl oligopeptidase